MTELDETFRRDLNKAVENAKAESRFELADYLSLRASNDAVREEGVKWLFDTVSEIVGAFNRHGAGIQIEQAENQKFICCGSNLSGSMLRFRLGLRRLTLDAGWTKSTTDGIMRSGALVCAKISHFGLGKQNEELVLLRFEEVPQWFSVAGDRHRVSFNVQSLKRHFEVFLG